MDNNPGMGIGKKILYFGGSFGAFIIIVGLVAFLAYTISNIQSLNQELSHNKEELTNIQNHQASVSSRGPRGPPGESGPAGPIGKSGGEIIGTGPLRNLDSDGAMVVDRLHGTGVASIAYLNKLSYQPNQIWTYRGNHQISNLYGDCLEGDQNTGDVYMSGCDSNSLKQKWNHNNYGQISLQDGGECLDISVESQFDGANKIVRGSQLGKDTSHFNLRRLKLKKCNEPSNLKATQQYVFV